MRRTIVTIAAAIFAGATAFNMGVAVQDIVHDHNEPQGVYHYYGDDQTTLDQEWAVDTATDGPPERMGAGTNVSPILQMPPLDADGMPMTNPCPWEAAQQGICTW
jgi:hypothetical protein